MDIENKYHKLYLDVDDAYSAGTLTDWYISSVDDSEPVWTDAHIEELVRDFYVIPRTAMLYKEER